MSFRRQLKATFKEMFGSSTGGKEPLDESSSKKAARNKTEKISKKGGAKTVSANESSVVAQLVQGPGAVIVAIATTASGASGGDSSSQDGQSRKVGNGAEASSSRKADHYADVKKNPPGVVLPLGVPCSEPEASPPQYTENNNLEPSGSKPSLDPWAKALEHLTTQERLDLFHQDTHPDINNTPPPSPQDEQGIITTLLTQSHTLLQTAEDRSWKFTNPLTGATVSLKAKMQSFIDRIDIYIRLGDIAIQHSPEITALVWSGVRLVMTLITNDADTWGILVETMEGVAGVMGRCRIYERMYLGGVTAGAKRVQEALIALYASMLVFTVKSKRYFAKGNMKRILTGGAKPFHVAFGPVVQNMRKCEARVEVEARAAAEEAAVADRGKMMDLLGGMIGVTIPELKVLTVQTNATVQRIRKAQEEEARSEILQWLSKVKYLDNHKTNARLREKGTGEWLFNRKEWKGVFGDCNMAEPEDWWDQPLEMEMGVQGEKPEAKEVETGTEELVDAGGLWLYGLPGTGKTVLTSLVIDHLNKEASTSKASLLAYFYCSYTEGPRRQAASLLSTILKQLAISLGNTLPGYGQDPSGLGLPKSLIEAYKDHKQQGFSTHQLDLSELENIIFGEILPTRGLQQVYIVIDAMDEMEEKEKKQLFPILQRFVESGVKIFVASRGGQRHVERAFGKKGWKRMGLEKSDTGGDIIKYIESQTEAAIESGDLLEGNVDDDLRTEIIESLVKGAEGMFLWVRYQVANLCEQETEHDIHIALKHLPTGMEETYTTLLGRIDIQSPSRKRLAYRVLQWMLVATRPLTPKELVEAVAIDPETDKQGIDAKKMMKGVEAIVDICGNFIAYDEQLGVLRFVHFTVQEFLEKRLVLASKENANARVVQVCLALLCFGGGWRIVLGRRDIGSSRGEGAETNKDLEDRGESKAGACGEQPELALAEYAVLNWGHHGKLALEWLAENDGSGNITDDKYMTHGALHTFLSPSSMYFHSWVKGFTQLSPVFHVHISDARAQRILPNQLFICVYFDFPHLFNLNFLSQTPELATPDYSTGWTHFHLAAALAAYHILGPLHKLLATKININTRDIDGRSPLHTIASSQRGGRGGLLWLSHEEALMTKKLLQYGCDPTLKETKGGNTAVHIAAEMGNLSCLRALLVYCSPLPVDIEIPTTSPISKIPKFTGSMLLEKQLNTFGNTPLHAVILSSQLHTVSAKFEVIMHLLALGGHDVNARDSFRLTPLEKVMQNAGMRHDMPALAQLIYDCGGLYDVKKPGLKNITLKEWGRGGMGPILFHSPMVASYRIAAAVLPGRTPAQVQSMAMMHQMGGRGRIDRGFFEKCRLWCEGENSKNPR